MKLLMDPKFNNLRRLLISAIPTSIFQLIINWQVSILFYIKVFKKKAYSEIIGYIPNTLIEKILLSFIFCVPPEKTDEMGTNGVR